MPTLQYSAIASLLHGSALMFVAYTGYGRIATLGEEVHHPRRTIPIAIMPLPTFVPYGYLPKNDCIPNGSLG
ncbi:hypothetical protein [Coleofasciculus chthonoplastes]|uniref:hypothetical protein n=1 Tax=Coleofasciculus chthonoplastes TaxID=64178 RepID=UPI0032F29B26